MPRLAKTLAIVIPPTAMLAHREGPLVVYRAVQQRIIPKYDRKNRRPRVIVMVQRWDDQGRRWLDFPIKPSMIAGGFRLCPNGLAALGIPIGSYYEWLRAAAAAADARRLARRGRHKARTQVRPGGDAGERPAKGMLERCDAT